jgi:hypothetical protein
MNHMNHPIKPEPAAFDEMTAAVEAMLAVAREVYEEGETEGAAGEVMGAVWQLEAFAHEVEGKPPPERGDLFDDISPET